MKYTIWFLKFFVALTVLIVVCVTPSQSQVNFKLGGGIGVTSAVSDFNGSTIEYYEGSRYGFTSGFNLLGKGKIGLAGLNITGEIDYTSLSNSGNSEPGQGKVDVSQKVLSVKVGPEFQISIPALPLTPYIGANIAMNNFSGETTFQGVSKVPSATYSVKSTSRLGVGFSLGAEVSVGPFLSLDFNAAYNFMNISGRTWEDVNPGIDQRIDSYLALNDGKDPQYAAGEDKHFVANERSIQSVLFTVSILFGL